MKGASSMTKVVRHSYKVRYAATLSLSIPVFQKRSRLRRRYQFDTFSRNSWSAAAGFEVSYRSRPSVTSRIVCCNSERIQRSSSLRPDAGKRCCELDRWILSELQHTIREVTDGLERYDTSKPAAALQEFLEDVSNWYLRRSRERFWKTGMDNDKVAAYLTLYVCLTTLVMLLAPFRPFTMEEMYQNLVRSVNGEAAFSVHLSNWPKVNAELLDEKLTNETHLVMRIVGLGRAAREKAQIKVRQPLNALFVRVADRDEEEALLRLSWQVLEELNIKQLHLMSDDSKMLAYTLKPQVKVLGPKYGLLLQKILAAFKALDAQGAQEAARALNETGKLNFTIDGQQIELTPDEIEVVATARPGFVAAEDRGYVVALETTMTPELREEGLVRDLTHYVQDMRKRAGFNIEDHIALALYTDEDLASILRRHKETLRSETLADNLSIVVGQPAASIPGEVYR